MLSFLTKCAGVVRGVLCGLDRLFLRGSLRGISYSRGLQHYLWYTGIPFKHFARHSQEVTARLEEASLRQARELGREVRYLNSAQPSKEDIAREIAARDRIRQGLVCVLTSVDPCMSFEIRKNRGTKKLEIGYRKRKCLHLYHYQIHPVFGFMHARIQTWFPFTVHVCLNGREWLARQMDAAGLKYQRRDNTFTWLEDVPRAQALFNEQLQANWPGLLGGLADALNPAHAEIFARFPCRYYWSVEDSEWASDVMFRTRADLEAVYPRLIRYAVTTFGTVDVLRFFGQPVPLRGKVPFRCRHEVSTNLKQRVEGVRIKHWVNDNSEKLYDKGPVLRPECTIKQPGDFKVFRSAEGAPDGPKGWRPLRKGVVDLPLRAAVSQAVNERYLEALAAVHDTTPLRELAEPLCRPVPEPSRRPAPAEFPPADSRAPQPGAPPTGPSAAGAGAGARWQPRRVRALNPLAADDAALLAAVSRHEFLINGLRNRDRRRLLFGAEASSPAERKRQAAAVTRKLRLLRGHGLIDKVPHTHRYLVTGAGRRAVTAVLAARNANADELTKCAA
jgi:hypothetical protein